MHHGGSVFEHLAKNMSNVVIIFLNIAHIVFHLFAESEDVEGLIGELHVLPVVDGGHGELALRHKPVVEDVVLRI